MVGPSRTRTTEVDQRWARLASARTGKIFTHVKFNRDVTRSVVVLSRLSFRSSYRSCFPHLIDDFARRFPEKLTGRLSPRSPFFRSEATLWLQVGALLESSNQLTPSPLGVVSMHHSHTPPQPFPYLPSKMAVLFDDSMRRARTIILNQTSRENDDSDAGTKDAT